MNPLVSIIVPVYNVERYLPECLDSILNQTLKEIEVICINDGSTDQSLEILKKYKKKDSRIVIINKQNSGYGHTMNMGVDRATGKYIGIVESDDYIKSSMFKTLYDTAEKYDAQIVKSDHYIFSSRERNKKEYKMVCPKEYYNKILNSKLCPEIFTFTMMNWTGIYKTDFIRENGIRHNETLGASFQDNGFWYQTISLAEKIVFINMAFYFYRQDNPNSSINSKEKVFCICDEYKFMQDFLKRHDEFTEVYYKFFFEKKFFNYMNSYKRIGNEFKLDFLEKIKQEFIEDLKEPKLKLSQIDPWIYKQMNRIIDSPRLFFIEDSIACKQEEYSKVHSRLVEIRNSAEFKRGLAIKKFLGMEI